MAKREEFIGEPLKYIVTLQAEGFDMERDDFHLAVTGCKIDHDYAKEELYHDLEGHFVLIIETANAKKGDLYIASHAMVPDTDFPGGIREEIDQQYLATLIPLKK